MYFFGGSPTIKELQVTGETSLTAIAAELLAASRTSSGH
jgi:hypothetical protein